MLFRRQDRADNVGLRRGLEYYTGTVYEVASNTKLFTAAMALQELGPQLRIRTSLYGSAKPGTDGALAGDLILYGRGDPTLLRPWNGGPYRPDPLEALARQLQDRGVRTIKGDLVGDDSYFSAPPFGPGWDGTVLMDSGGALLPAAGAEGALGAALSRTLPLMTNDCPHPLQRTFFPSSPLGPFSCDPQCGQVIVIVAGMSPASRDSEL